MTTLQTIHEQEKKFADEFFEELDDNLYTLTNDDFRDMFKFNRQSTIALLESQIKLIDETISSEIKKEQAVIMTKGMGRSYKYEARVMISAYIIVRDTLIRQNREDIGKLRQKELELPEELQPE